MRCKLFVLLIVLINLSPLVLAEVELGNISHDIKTVYGKSQLIQGWINVSFDKQSADTVISAFDSNITLENLLDENDLSCNLASECTCLPNDCESIYSTTSSSSDQKDYLLGLVSTKLFGVELTENITGISSFKFNVTTDARDSCLPPVMIDLFDDQTIEYRMNEVSDDICFSSNPYGCYNPADLKDNAPIEDDLLCGKITLPPARGYMVGANIIGTGSAGFTLTMELGGIGNSCTKSVNTETEVSCKIILDESLESEAEAEVCIFANAGSLGQYSINFEDTDTCGFLEDKDTGERISHDFEIFANPLKYKASSQFVFDNDLLIDETLQDKIFSYIDNKYSFNCDSGCVIPLKIFSGTNQNLTISDLLIDFEVGGLNTEGSEETAIYNLEKSPALISSDFIQLDLKGLSVPSSSGEKDLILKIGDEQIKEDITIIDVPEVKNIIPTKASFLVSTKFNAVLEDDSDNLTFIWDFGDGVVIETTSNEVEHTYSELGNYELTLNVSNELGTSTKKTTVKVISPYDAINQTIEDYRKRLKVVDSSLFALDEWIEKEILKVVNIDEQKSIIDKLEDKYELLFESEEEELVKIMKDLVALEVPTELGVSLEVKPAKFVQNQDRLDLQKLELEFDAGNYEDGKDYYNAINEWLNENLDLNIESKTYSFYYSDGSEKPVLSYITFDLNPKTDIEEFYMVIEGDISKIKFNGDYKEKELDNGFGIRFTDLTFGNKRKIELTYPERIDIFNAPVYVSPEFRKLQLGDEIGICNNNNVCDPEENYKNCRADCKPWNLIFLYLGILLGVAFIIYIILQEWYKRYYESHLFKNKNQLFNLLTFMSNTEKQKMKKENIFRMLKPYKWKDEQLEYAWKKLHGKRTGMWEIPIFKPLEKMKVKKEIAKRSAAKTPQGVVLRK